jgi:hypothetical protein
MTSKTLLSLFLLTTPYLLSEALEEEFLFFQDAKEYFDSEITLPSAWEPETKRELLKKSKVKIEVIFLEYGVWEITFTFPKSVIFTASEQDDSFYIQFNQGVSTPDLLKLQTELGFLIKRLVNGYSSLEFTPKRQVLYTATSHNETFTLRISLADDSPIEPTQALEIGRARLLIEKRDYALAECTLQKLQEKYKDNKDIAILQAALDGLKPNWKRQFNQLKELRETYPEDVAIKELYYAAYTPHSSYGRLERQLQITEGLAIIRVNKVAAEAMIWNKPEHTFYIGGEWQLSQGDIHQIVNKQGGTVSFNEIRNQGTLYGKSEWSSGLHLTGYLYGQKTNMGTGAQIGALIPTIQGAFDLFAAWHKPYWSLFETQAFHGKEDRIELNGNFAPNRYFNGAVSGAFHRVGITDTKTAFYSLLTSINLFGNLRTVNPIIAINYGLDAEYVLYEKFKQATVAPFVPYNPVPYDSFENHSFRGYIFYNWKKYWYFTGFGGGTVNRISGAASPTYGIAAKFAKPCPYGVEFELSATHFPSTVVEGAAAEYFTGTLTARF